MREKAGVSRWKAGDEVRIKVRPEVQVIFEIALCN